MKYIKLFEIHKEELKKEVDIIYRDKNMICLVPKSQMASCVYGQGTRWCTKSKSGFDSHKDSIMFRFIFKSKYKLRLTYDPHGQSDWSDRSGNQFFGKLDIDKNSLFKISKDDITQYKFWNKKYDPTGEKTNLIIKYIKKIPLSCQKAVLNYINENSLNKIKKDKEHVPYKDRNKENEFNELDKKLKLKYGNLNHISYGFDKNTQEFYYKKYDGNNELRRIRFNNIKKYEDELTKLIEYYE